VPGLAGESQAATAARLIGVEEAAGGLTVHLNSDGLSLDDKLALERVLKSRLGDLTALGLGANETLFFYFKRLNKTDGAPTAGPESKGPAPLANRKGPFGLTVDRRAIPGVTEIIVVASGKGGVGKSTVSANLAVALAQAGARTGLLDADIYGPSAPLMMGVQGPMPVLGESLVPLTAHGVKIASFGFLTDTQEPVIWRGPLIAKAFRQLCYDVAWGELDYLVVDLPPGTGDIQLALIESVPVHGALIVTTPQDVALLDAHKALSMFEKLDVPVLGLVENMAYYVCSCCGQRDPVFGEGGADRMAQERQVPVLTRVSLNGALRARSDSGRPVALGDDPALAAPFIQLARVVRER